MDPIIGLIVFAIGAWRVIGSIDEGIHKMRAGYRQRAAAWRASNPAGIRATRVAGFLSTVWHGTKPFCRAFADDWRDNWQADKARVKAWEARRLPGTPPTPAAVPPRPAARPVPAAPPGPAAPAVPTPPTAPVPTEPVPPPAPVPAVPAPVAPAAKPHLSLVPATSDERTTEPMRDIRTTQDLRDGAAEIAEIAVAEREGAAQTAARHHLITARVQHMADRAPAIVDNDPAAQAAFATLADEQAHLEAAMTAIVAMFDRVDGAARNAVAKMEGHRVMEEAKSATPAASSETDAYESQ